MNLSEKRETLEERQRKKQPFHALPHFCDGCPGTYFITAANYLHHSIIGYSNKRMREFTNDVLTTVADVKFIQHAYCVLPNHYHLLVEGPDPAYLRNLLGKLHGRSSRRWNQEEDLEGRKVWYRVLDKPVTSNRQFYSILNYIHYNPVKAGLCTKATDWTYSSFRYFLESHDRERVIQLWRDYPPEKI